MMENLDFRKAEAIDLDLFYGWRNEDAVMKNSFKKNEVPSNDHIKWFEEKINDNNCLMYVLLVNTIPAGQVRFDVEGEEAVISISLDKDFRGRSIGCRGIKLLSNEAIKKNKIKKIVALIKPENKTSIKAFTGAGYALERVTKYRGQKAELLVFKG